MLPWPVDHVGVAVHSIDAIAPVYELITGASRSEEEILADQGVRVVFIGAVELLEPTAPESPVARFLERRAPGLHHIAFRVPDVAATLEALREKGHTPIDDAPRTGARGHRIAFLHPRDAGGVLIELVEE
jgi:methylmalonyl-CoA epimerase